MRQNASELADLRQIVGDAHRAHGIALQAVKELVAPPIQEVPTAEEARMQEQLAEGDKQALHALAFLRAWAGEQAEQERQQQLAALLREAQQELEQTRSRAESRGIGQEPHSRGSYRQVPELKCKTFSSTDPQYSVQQFLFVIKSAAEAAGLDHSCLDTTPRSPNSR